MQPASSKQRIILFFQESAARSSLALKELRPARSALIGQSDSAPFSRSLSRRERTHETPQLASLENRRRFPSAGARGDADGPTRLQSTHNAKGSVIDRSKARHKVVTSNLFRVQRGLGDSRNVRLTQPPLDIVTGTAD